MPGDSSTSGILWVALILALLTVPGLPGGALRAAHGPDPNPQTGSVSFGSSYR